uniref:Uncharacterized protein n=1 Tax=Anguilla anguilla TaxID=7936 RepID=A0A0E9X7M7_ANGAN
MACMKQTFFKSLTKTGLHKSNSLNERDC